jgi:oligoribonuclease NrnB/cAMP/cGMP phosphodiesterase (DHH superfamily)
MIKPTLCVAHAPCSDGYTAAWVVWKKFGSDVKFHPGKHGEAPPDATGERVVIVDFSYPKAILLEMNEKAESLLILDHHSTAQDDLKGLPPACMDWGDHVAEGQRHADEPLRRLGVQFDMTRSGAGMTWDYFNPGKPRPKLVQHVQDRDLWQFKIDGTREIQAWVFSHPYDFETWSALAQQLETEEGWESAFGQGAALERKLRKDIAEVVEGTQREMTIGGHRVLVANMPWTMASQAAGDMANADTSRPFAAVYFDDKDGVRQFSLRSRGDFHVGNFAKEMGVRFGTSGGGHAGAAGFRAPPGWEGE